MSTPLPFFVTYSTSSKIKPCVGLGRSMAWLYGNCFVKATKSSWIWEKHYCCVTIIEGYTMFSPTRICVVVWKALIVYSRVYLYCVAVCGASAFEKAVCWVWRWSSSSTVDYKVVGLTSRHWPSGPGHQHNSEKCRAWRVNKKHWDKKQLTMKTITVGNCLYSLQYFPKTKLWIPGCARM